MARAVSTGILKWTDFFADPVAELADAERQTLCGGIVRWFGRSHELIAFEEGRTVRNLDSFQAAQVADLMKDFNLDTTRILEELGCDRDQSVRVRYL